MKTFDLANKIRTNLLITINNELNEYKTRKNVGFFLNSKPLKEYEKLYEKFVIIERNSITGTVGTYKKETYSDNFYKVPLKLKFPTIEETDISTHKITLTKNVLKTKRKKTQKVNILKKNKYDTQQKKISGSIKSLRYFCSHLKDYENQESKIIRVNSHVLRRKKYNKIGSNSYILSVKSFELKEENKPKHRQSVIQLQKMWDDNKVKTSLKKKQTSSFFDNYLNDNKNNKNNKKKNILLLND